MGNHFRPKGLLRSFTLWSGVLVLAFLLWAWSDSRRNYTSYAGFGFGTLYVGIGNTPSIMNTPGGMIAGYNRRSAAGPPLWTTGLDITRSPLSATGIAPDLAVPLWFPPAISVDPEEDDGISGRTASVSLAHWFLVLIAVSLWGFLFHLRSRRLSRATQSSSHSD